MNAINLTFLPRLRRTPDVVGYTTDSLLSADGGSL